MLRGSVSIVLAISLCFGITGYTESKIQFLNVNQSSVQPQSFNQEESLVQSQPFNQEESSVLPQPSIQEESSLQSPPSNQQTTTSLEQPKSDFVYDYNDANAVGNNQVAYHSKWLYYVESDTFYDTDLYRFNESTGKGQRIERLLTNHMMCWKQYLYFSIFLQEGDKVEGIYRFDPKTKRITLIHEGENLRFFIHQDMLYVSDPKEQYLQKMDMDGSHIEGTKLPSTQYVVQGNYFYTSVLSNNTDSSIVETSDNLSTKASDNLSTETSDSLTTEAADNLTTETSDNLSDEYADSRNTDPAYMRSIVRYDSDGKKDTVVAIDSMYGYGVYDCLPICFQIYADKLYYIDNGGFVRAVNVDGSKPKVIINEPVNSMIIDKDGTIYCGFSTGSPFHAYDRKGKLLKEMKDIIIGPEQFYTTIIGITPTQIIYRLDIYDHVYDVIGLDKKTNKSCTIGSKLKSDKSICSGYKLPTPKKETDKLPNSLDSNYRYDQVNLNYGGYVTSNSKWQFFIQGMNHGEQKLCQMKLDCSSVSVIDEGWVDNLICSNQYLYYTITPKESSRKTGIYRYDMKNKKKQLIQEGPCYEFAIDGDSLYYYCYEEKYIMKRNLKDKTDVPTKVPTCRFQYYKKHFYSVEFTSNTQDELRLVRYDLNGNQEIIKDNIEYMDDGFDHRDLINYQIYNDRIYYIAPFNHSLHMVSTDGTVKKEIYEKEIMTFLIDKDGTLYTMPYHMLTSYIRKSDLNGKITKEKMYENYDLVELCGITKDYLFYKINLGEGNYYFGNVKKDGTDAHRYEK